MADGRSENLEGASHVCLFQGFGFGMAVAWRIQSVFAEFPKFPAPTPLKFPRGSGYYGRKGASHNKREYDGEELFLILLNSCGRCNCPSTGPLQVCLLFQPPPAPSGPTGPYRFRRSYESIQSLVAFTTFLGSMLGGQKVTNCCWKKERKENCILCSSEQVLSKKIIG